MGSTDPHTRNFGHDKCGKLISFFPIRLQPHHYLLEHIDVKQHLVYGMDKPLAAITLSVGCLKLSQIYLIGHFGDLEGVLCLF